MKQRILSMILILTVIVCFQSCVWPVEMPRGEWISEDGSITLNFDDLTGVWSDGEPFVISSRGNYLALDKLKYYERDDIMWTNFTINGEFELEGEKLTIQWYADDTSTVFIPLEQSTESTE